MWTKKLAKHCRPSAVEADGNIYWLADNGECTVVKAADKFELISRNDLGEPCNASPVISNGQIFIRSDVGLSCIAR
jgi:hypothetical protein